MKPRTKIQKTVASISCELKLQYEEILEYYKNKIEYKRCFLNKSTAYCMQCGGSWKNNNIKNKSKIVCPHCGETLNAEFMKLRTDSNVDFGARFRTAKKDGFEFQVITYYCIKSYYKCGEQAKYEIYDVAELYYEVNKNLSEIITRYPTMYGTYSPNSSMELRNYSNQIPYHSAEFIYNKGKIHDVLRKKGFSLSYKGTFSNRIIEALLKKDDLSIKVETLLKTKRSHLAGAIIYHEGDYWKTLCICHRHNYKIKNAISYFDYLEQLEELGRDLHNPKFVCPKNFEKAHLEAGKALQAKRDREYAIAKKKREKEALQEEMKHNEKYIKKMSRFFSLLLKVEDLTITPLKSINDFMEEGKSMHHCVFANRYYLRNSLILSVRDKENNHVATVEVSLKNFNIVQCQGVCNSTPEKYNIIVSEVKKALPTIHKLAKQSA